MAHEAHSTLFELTTGHLPRVSELTRKYADLPMDLADASVVILAEELGTGRILSTDMRDFRTYRWKIVSRFRTCWQIDGVTALRSRSAPVGAPSRN